MRDCLVKVWRNIQKSKKAAGFVRFISWFIDTEIFNWVIDLLERITNRKKLEANRVFYKDNMSRIKENLNCLADDKSRRVYKNAILYRGTLKRKYLCETSSVHEKYFAPDIIRFKMNEVFIDGGAFTGDTALSLEAAYPYWNDIGASCTIFCWEADRYNRKLLEDTLNGIECRHENVKTYMVKKAAWNREEMVSFDVGVDFASRVDETGRIQVQADSIDNVMEEAGKCATFIKMDIEGAELKALEGARRTIEKYNPTMAICIYHTNEQMIEIIEWFRNNFPFYKLYIRHYARNWTETVVYAVVP